MGRSSRRNLAARRPGNGALQHQQVLEVSSYSGPLPPAQQLERYNQIFPGCADRIVTMAEKQSDHRQDLEKLELRVGISSERLGAVLAFLVVMSAIFGGLYLITIGKDAMGMAAIISSLAALAGVFVYGRHAQMKERDRKTAPFPPISGE